MSATDFGSSEAGKLGGKARSDALTPERRSEIARKAVEARWKREGKLKEVAQATHGSPDHPLKIGEVEIPCFVLSDGKRVLTQSGLLKSLGLSKGGGEEGSRSESRLARFASGKAMSTYISSELEGAVREPIHFRLQNGVLAYGFEATILADICDAVLRAREAGALLAHQQHIAKQCEILVRGFARVGIIALVDEATGYQADRKRDALAKILEAFIAKELRPYVRTFEPDFYQELFRLKGLEFNGTLKAPRYIGKDTNDLVYDRLAPGVRTELNRMNPTNEKGQRKHKNFQWLTQQVGYQKLKEHLRAVTVLMKVFDDWDSFKKSLDKVLPRQDPAPLFDPDTKSSLTGEPTSPQ